MRAPDARLVWNGARRGEKWRADLAELTDLPEAHTAFTNNQGADTSQKVMTGLQVMSLTSALVGTTHKGTISCEIGLSVRSKAGAQENWRKGSEVLQVGNRGTGQRPWNFPLGDSAWVLSGGGYGQAFVSASEPIWDLWPRAGVGGGKHSRWGRAGNVRQPYPIMAWELCSCTSQRASHFSSSLPMLLCSPPRTAKAKLLRDTLYFFDKT